MLDALRIILFRTLSRLNVYPGRVPLRNSDITIGREDLTAELNFMMSGVPFLYTINGPKKKQSDDFRYVVGLKPDSRNILKLIEKSREDLLAVYFSPHRSLLTAGMPSTRASAGDWKAAFADALLRRPLRFREFADWWVVQEKLSQENADISTHRLKILANSVTRFLEGYTNLRAVYKPKTTLLLNKNGVTLDVRQLSDGERGLLALVFDLARRLSLANPDLDDPLRDGKAVVLIDELDLHLHPRWQRTIVEKLTRTFPNCQFIATTHSPFIVQSLKPGQLINLEPPKFAEEYADKSVEDIAEFVMGTPMPQKSVRYQRMMETAERYFRVLRSAQPSSSEEKEELKRKLDELSIPFSDDPTYMALLKVEREMVLGKDDHETS